MIGLGIPYIYVLIRSHHSPIINSIDSVRTLSDVLKAFLRYDYGTFRLGGEQSPFTISKVLNDIKHHFEILGTAYSLLLSVPIIFAVKKLLDSHKRDCLSY